MSCIIESAFERIDGLDSKWCSGEYVVMLVFGEKKGWDVVGSIILIQVSIFVCNAIGPNVFSSMQTFWLNGSLSCHF